MNEMLDPETELNAVVGVQIVSQLKEAGVGTSPITDKKPTLKKLLEMSEVIQVKKSKDEVTSTEQKQD